MPVSGQSSYTMKNAYSAVIAVPTINSSTYIQRSLKRLVREIEIIEREFPVDLIVCVNGTEDGGRTVHEVNEFRTRQPGIRLHLIEMREGGKNRAINRIVEFAKSHRYEIIHFVDDDVYFKRGTLLLNFRELIRQEPLIGTPLCVGSHFVGIDRCFRDFLQKEKSFVRAIRSWFWHNVFITPFRMNADKPRFCSGQSICFYVCDIPVLPLDETGITDDVYLGHYFAYIAEDWYRATGISPVIKPDGSFVFFNIPTDYAEWERQQIRTCVGILAGFDHFNDKRQYLEEFMRWAYGYNRNCLRKEHFAGLVHCLFFRIHFYLAGRIIKKSKDVMARKGVVPWGIAMSTK